MFNSSTMSQIPQLFGDRNNSTFDPDLSNTSTVITIDTSAEIDWCETPELHMFLADVPGMKKEEVKVEVVDGKVLQISGEGSSEKDEKNDTWHMVERSRLKFLRRFGLPDNVNIEEIKAGMEDGVLTVTIPKVEEKKPVIKSIPISG